MIAFQIGVNHPERVRSLTLAAGQAKPPRVLMAIQEAIMRLLGAGHQSNTQAPDRFSAVLNEFLGRMAS